MSEKIVQTAGRDQLGGFAPAFAHLNDDVLPGKAHASPLPAWAIALRTFDLNADMRD